MDKLEILKNEVKQTQGLIKMIEKTKLKDLKRKLEKDQRLIMEIEKAKISALKTKGWLTWDEISKVIFSPKRNVKMWVESVVEKGGIMKIRMVCVNGEIGADEIKGKTIEKTIFKSNSGLLISKFKREDIFNVSYLSLASYPLSQLAQKKFGGQTLYQVPDVFENSWLRVDNVRYHFKKR